MTRTKDLLTHVGSILISIVIAFCLWLAVAGQNRTSVELDVSLQMINLPENLIIYEDIPSTITIQVLANTAQIRVLNDRKPSLLLNAQGASDGHNVLIVDENSLELPRGVIVEKITPDTIEFTATTIMDQVVNLNPVISGLPESAFRVKSLTLEPNKVILKGPQGVLSSISSLSTHQINLDGLTRSTTRTVTPDLSAWRNEGLTTIPEDVRAIISIEERQMGQVFTNIPIELDIKNGSGVKQEELTISPSTAEIEVSWAASRQTAVTVSDIRVRVFVDVEEYKKSGNLLLPVVVAAPDGVAVTSINPVHVKVSYVPGHFPEVDGAAKIKEKGSKPASSPPAQGKGTK